MPLRTGHHGRAKSPGADERQQEMPLWIRAIEKAHLEHLLNCIFARFGNSAGVFNSSSHRRFAINVFARLERGDRDLAVQMRRRGHQDCLNVVIVENLAVILFGDGAWGSFGRTLDGRFIIVADGSDLRLWQAPQRRYDFSSPRAESDDSAFDLGDVAVV